MKDVQEESSNLSKLAHFVLSCICLAYLLTFDSFPPQFLYVYSQYETDADFPTLPFPNPEEGAEVLKMALKTAEENNSDVVVANDPDADRMGLAEKRGGGSWRIFTGVVGNGEDFNRCSGE